MSTKANAAIVKTTLPRDAESSILFRIAGAISSSATLLPALSNASTMQSGKTLFAYFRDVRSMNPVFCQRLYFGFGAFFAPGLD